MRRLTAIAALATLATLPLAAAPAGAAFSPTGGVAEMVRATHLVCRTDLRGSACAVHQQWLLSAVMADARSSNRADAAQQVASRQLDVLIASVR